MVSVLFNCYFLLAKGLDDGRRLEVVACIYLGDLKEETIQNGQGKCSPRSSFALEFTC